MKNMIEWLQDQCALYWYFQQIRNIFHEMKDYSITEFSLKNISYWKKKYKYSKNSIYFTYSISGNIYSLYYKKKIYIRKDIIISIYLAMFRMKHYLCKKIMRELMNREIIELKNYYWWLIKKYRMIEMNDINTFIIFEYLYKKLW